jgi:hypothetical protein
MQLNFKFWLFFSYTSLNFNLLFVAGNPEFQNSQGIVGAMIAAPFFASCLFLVVKLASSAFEAVMERLLPNVHKG